MYFLCEKCQNRDVLAKTFLKKKKGFFNPFDLYDVANQQNKNNS